MESGEDRWRLRVMDRYGVFTLSLTGVTSGDISDR